MAAPPHIARANGMKGGRPPGVVDKRTREKKEIEKQIQNMIMKKAAPMVRAGMSVALGQMFVYRIDEEYEPDKTKTDKKTGEETVIKGSLRKRVHVLVTDPDEIAEALDKMEGMGHGSSADEAYYYVTTKEPDTAAMERLWNRAFGKPKESLTVDGEVKFSLTGLARQRDEMLNGNADMVLLDESESIDEPAPTQPAALPSSPVRDAVVVEVSDHPTDTIVITKAV